MLRESSIETVPLSRQELVEPGRRGLSDPLDQAATVLTKLRRMVPHFAPGPGLTPPSPGVRAQLTRPYVEGFAAAMAAADPMVLQAIADELTDRFCEHPPLEDGQRMLYAQLAESLPPVLTSEGLDCFLANTEGTEDGPVWDMVQAWRSSGMQKTPRISALERTAQDSRTRALFASPEELAKLHAVEMPSPELAPRVYTSTEREQATRTAAAPATIPVANSRPR